MSPTIDPGKLKVTELREELQARGLDTKGNKPVLVKRLKKALEEELDRELPDTSIVDTTTEDMDASLSESTVKAEEMEASNEQNVDDSNQEGQEETNQEEVPTLKKETEELKVDEATTEEVKVDEEQNVTEKESDETETSQVEESAMEVTNGQESRTETSELDDKCEDESAKNEEKIDTIEGAPPTSDDQPRGEKRRQSGDAPPPSQRRRARSPAKEDEPEIDSDKVTLSWFDSDLHLQIDKYSLLSAKPIHEGLFGYAWAGARTSHGVHVGKAHYEVKITEELRWQDFTNQRKEKQERREKERQRNLAKLKKAEDDKPKEESEEKSGEEGDEKIKEEPDTVEVKKEYDDTQAVIKEEPKEENSETEKTELPVEDVKKEEECDDEAKENEKDELETKEESNEISSPEEPILTHIIRVGWSSPSVGLQLGEDEFSYGYESTGKFVTNKEFKDFGAPFKLGDVVGAYLEITDENVVFSYTVNGELQPETVTIARSDLPQENFALYPHVLSRNLGFELNVGNKDEPWFASPAGYEDYPFIQSLEDKVQGPQRPEKREDCEVTIMCGLPSSGKTHWVRQYLQSNPDKRITVIGGTNLLEKMTVRGKPLRSNYNGRWDMLIDKLQRCLNRLNETAARRRRNFIIDQTNVFPSLQRRYLRAFEGFKRRAVVVVVGDEEQAKRHSLKEEQDGKDLPDFAILEMKGNMTLPTKSDQWDEIIYTDLSEDEAKAQVTKYNAEGRPARFQHSYGRFPYDRNRPPHKFDRVMGNDFNQGGFRERDYQRFNRTPRGWGHPPRFMRDRRPPPPMSGSRDWMRNNRGPPRSNDRNGRDNRPPPSYNRNRNQGPPAQGGGRPANWQSGGGGSGGYSQPAWGGQQGSWGGSSTGQNWSGSYGYSQQQQPQGSWNTSNQWKYGSAGHQPSGYGHQSGYNQNWNNYYGQYQQNWTGQAQQQSGAEYAQWAEYAQQYAQNGSYDTSAQK